jgi:hypothetical protein
MESADVDVPETDLDLTPTPVRSGPAPHIPRQSTGEPAAPADAFDAGDGLTERERQVLAFERQWWRYAGAKEQAIRDMFGVSSTRYYQLLNALLDNPAALAYDPVLVQRLRRLRATRSRARASGHSR